MHHFRRRLDPELDHVDEMSDGPCGATNGWHRCDTILGTSGTWPSPSPASAAQGGPSSPKRGMFSVQLSESVLRWAMRFQLA